MRNIPSPLFYAAGMVDKKRKPLSAPEQEVLDQVEIRLLNSPEDIERCDRLIAKHHYLRAAALVGQHLRYTAVF
ncbi:MAG: hypothetical protein ACI9VS_003151 [Candidatus Binatia bacterium]